MSICGGAYSTQPLSLQHFSRRCLSRYTSCIQFHMHRSLTALAFCFLVTLPLFAQAPSQTTAATAAPAFPNPAHGEKIHIPGIPNAGKITDFLYRGAQPREGGFSGWKFLGTTTIGVLRGGDAEKTPGERSHAEPIGMS